MIRPATLILFALSAVAGAVLFGVAFEVNALEERLLTLNKRIAQDREAIHVLRAEWSYLNQPERLEGLSQRYLDLQPLQGEQMAVVAAVPARATREPDPRAQDPSSEPTLAAELAVAVAARPKIKPPAPPRPSQRTRVVARPASATSPENGVKAPETAALDAALRAILGDRGTAGGSTR